MKRVVAMLVWAGLAAACSDTTLPPNLLLSCDSDADCPDNLVCEPASLRCVPERGGDGLEVTASVDTALVGSPLIGSPVTATLSFNAALTGTPSAHLANGLAALDDVEAVETGDGTFTVTYTPTGDEPDGAYRIEVEAIDARGLPQRFVTDAAVLFDFTPPAAVAVSLQRFPNPQRTPVAFEILDEVAVGPAVDVRVVLSPSEPVFLDGSPDEALADPAHIVVAGDPAAPSVATETPGDLVFVRNPASANPLLFDLDWERGGVDGSHRLIVRITDLAGNVSEDVLEIPGGAVDVDTTPPAEPEVDVDDAIVFERAPWGRLDAAQRDVYRLVGQPGAVEASGRLLVSRDPEGRVELGRANADAEGAFVAPNADVSDPTSVGFPTGDLATVFVRVADAAGNVSTAIAVRDVRWLVTPLDKVPGDTVKNPHHLDEVGILGRNLEQGGAVERGGADGVQAPDVAALVTVGAGSWRRVPSDDPQSLAPSSFGTDSRGVVNASLATDPIHGVTLLFGGTNFGIQQGPAGFVADGRCTQQTADHYLRGFDDRWRRKIPDVLEPSPVTSLRTALAFVPPLGRLVLLMHGGETWSFDGSTWEQLCTRDGCMDGDPALMEQSVVTGLTWDARRQVLVAALGGQLFEYDPLDPAALWHTTTASGDFSQGLAYSERLGVVALSGTSFTSWDGASTTALCTDAACAASAPTSRSGARFAYDRRHDEFVVFGGDPAVVCNYNAASAIVGSGGLAPQPGPAPTETFTFDGTAWTQHAPATSPPGRTRHAMAWDELRQRVVLVGGDECDCLGSQVSLTNMTPGLPNDTWEWDGSTWTRVGTARTAVGFNRANPPALRDHAMVEAPTQGGVIVFDERAQGVHMFNGDAWFSTSNGNGFIGRRMAMFATAPSGEIMGFGGGDETGSSLATTGPPFQVRVNGANGLDLACAGDPSLSPQCAFPSGQRRFGGAAFNDGNRFWIFGGSDLLTFAPPGREVAADRANNELWSWSQNEGWLQHCTGGECGAEIPGKRILHRGVVDGDGAFIVFGGLVNDAQTTDETWSFDGATWTRIGTGGDVPPAREGHAMAFDAERGVVMVAYGTDLGGIHFREPSQFDPGSSLVPHIVPDALSEVWELSAGTWRQAPTSDPEGDGRPSPRQSVVAAGLPGGGVALMGGTPSPAVTYADVGDFIQLTPRADDSWVWNGGVNSRPAHRFQVDTQSDVSLLQDLDVITGLEVTWRARAGRTDVDVDGGVDLLWWDGEGWRGTDPANVVDCGAGCVGAVLSAEDARLALQSPNQTLNVVVVPKDDNGAGPGRVVLSSDALEVALRWRRP